MAHKKWFFNCSLLTLIVFSFKTFALDKPLPQGLHYELRNTNNQIIHILTINPKEYQLKLVKAHNRVFGRETVPAMALRRNAIAAINAGFFEIGKSEDGRPAGSLIIQGEPFTLAKNKRALLAWDDHKIYMSQATVHLKLSIHGKPIVFNKFNDFAENKDIVLYNAAFGRSTLSAHDRQEVLLDRNKQILEIVRHGDNSIPDHGWVISFPKEARLGFIQPGDTAKIDLQLEPSIAETNHRSQLDNVVMGIPLLIHQGVMRSDLETAGGKEFASSPHARTALGLKTDGSIIMIVAEHPGLSLVELAKLFLQLGCKEAINLDGGGSSTLFLNGHVINTAIGDKDESLGIYTIRPVSDAIVVIKREPK